CAPLCAAIDSPEEDGVDCWEFIRSLQEENLFIIKLDAENQWFRYHHLFQQLLRNQLERHYSRDEITALHSTASSWFADNGPIEMAIEHALAAGDETRAVQLIEQNRQKALNEDKWYLLEKWLSKFYDTIIDRHPSLLMTKAWVLYHQFEIPAIPPILDTCQSLMDETSADHPLRGEIDFFRGYIYYFINEGAHSLKHLRAARKNVPPDSEEVRGQVEILHGLATQMEGRKEEAVTFLNDLLTSRRGPQGVSRTRLLVTFVYIHIIAGDLDQAVEANRHLLEFSTRGGYEYARVWAVYLQGLIHFYRNNMEMAKDHFKQAVNHLYLMHTRAAADCMAGLTYACQTLQQPDEADAALEALREYSILKNDPACSLIVRSCETRLAIMRGDPVSTPGWGQGSHPPDENMVWWLEIPAVTHCRALVAEGSDKSLDKAETRLIEILELNRKNHNSLQMVDILSLLALASKKRGRVDEALEFLTQALDLAAHGSLVRPFVEPGPPMADLLNRLSDKNIHRDHIRLIMAAFQEGEEEIPTQSPVLSASPPFNMSPQFPFEALTNREFDVLDLLAQRLQNKEIAEKLFISPETVRAHLKRIYQKLNVKNRREAVDTAVNLGLITRP
ncbi:LuxR C-terminal-related transcriptional regulator, partial [bacterium]|nr:LuxR C-terminal-related transcriptional regulator [bacterium]